MVERKDFQLLKDEFQSIYTESLHFDCNVGWFDLIRNFSLEFTQLIQIWMERQKTTPDDEAYCVNCVCPRYLHEDQQHTFNLAIPKVETIKEKFGQIRIYPTYYIDAMEPLIGKYESLSGYICEDCGEPGIIRKKRYWLRAQCDSCFNKSS